MPRAPQLNEVDPADCREAATYVLPKVRKAIGVYDDLVSGGGCLHNAKTMEVFAVSLSTLGDDGALRIYTYNGVPMNAPHAPVWMVFLESASSDILMIPWADLHPGTPQVRAVDAGGGWTCLHVNAGWLKNAARHSLSRVKNEKSFKEIRAIARASKEDFCHLHVHSMYSFLDGVSTPEALVQRAVENGQPGIALTDHGYMFGTYKFYKAARERGIQPVLGCEFNIVDDVNVRYKNGLGNDRRFEYHITVLAMNQEGWFNICKLNSLAARDHFYHVPRIDNKMLFENNAGLFVMSGCFKGMVAWHLQDYTASIQGRMVHDKTYNPNNDESRLATGHFIYQKNPDRSYQIAQMYKQVFGDRYVIEAHNNTFERYMPALPAILQLAADLDIPVAVAADAHYEMAEDAVLQNLMSKVGKNQVGDGLGAAPVTEGCYFIRTMDEINHPLFSRDMLTRTREIMERCKVHIPLPKSDYFKGDADFKFLFPSYDVVRDKDWADFQSTQPQCAQGLPAVAPATYPVAGLHPNSLAAYRALGHALTDRAQAVYDELARAGAGTDRQLMHRMGFTDPNMVRPRISELIDLGLVAEVGSVIDMETHKTVRTVDLAERQQPNDERAPENPLPVMP